MMRKTINAMCGKKKKGKKETYERKQKNGRNGEGLQSK